MTCQNLQLQRLEAGGWKVPPASTSSGRLCGAAAAAPATTGGASAGGGKGGEELESLKRQRAQMRAASRALGPSPTREEC